MSLPADAACETCVFFSLTRVPRGESSHFGVCRRYAPMSVQTVYEPRGPVTDYFDTAVVRWPIVDPFKDWCGQYQHDPNSGTP